MLFVTALMNIIGVLTISLNLHTINCHPSYSVALDAMAVVFFSVGSVCALMEIQNCFRKTVEETESVPQTGPNRPPAVGLAFLTS